MLRILGKIVGIAFMCAVLFAYNSGQQDVNQVQKAKIYQEIYELLTETDLYCSFRVIKDERPDTQIIGAKDDEVRKIFSDGDSVILDKGRQAGVEPGQLFLIVEIESRNRVQDENKPLFQYGDLAIKKGRARVVSAADSQATAVIEKSCHEVRVGDFVVPFVPLDTMMGKDLGYDVPPFEGDGPKGEVVYLQTERSQIGSGGWALVSLGADQGIQIGQQLILYRAVSEGAPLMIFGNSVVIDVQSETATVKVLSCRDAVRIGDRIMTRPAY
jgi:hypothetical protein